MKKDYGSARDERQDLSETWQELLGLAREPQQHDAPTEEPMPGLTSDPWNELARAQGTEVVDLHAIQWQVSDQDIEQALEIMQEQQGQAEQDADSKHRRTSNQ
ncbi:MAG TPA: hypothetical protein VHZ51_20920 [Ktedonobacteraceae bacterium]|nr:hypothetical protein [Ktedonobacteraceae bacterium]